MMILIGLMVVTAIAVVVSGMPISPAEAEALEPVRIPVRVDESDRSFYGGGRRF